MIGSCLCPRLFGFDEKAAEAEAEAFYFIGGAEIGFGNSLFCVFQHGAGVPAKTGDIVRYPTTDFSAMRASMPGRCITLPDAEGVEVLFASVDFTPAFIAAVWLTRLNDLVAEDGRRIVIAVAIVTHARTALAIAHA